MFRKVVNLIRFELKHKFHQPRNRGYRSHFSAFLESDTGKTIVEAQSYGNSSSNDSAFTVEIGEAATSLVSEKKKWSVSQSRRVSPQKLSDMIWKVLKSPKCSTLSSEWIWSEIKSKESQISFHDIAIILLLMRQPFSNTQLEDLLNLLESKFKDDYIPPQLLTMSFRSLANADFKNPKYIKLLDFLTKKLDLVTSGLTPTLYNSSIGPLENFERLPFKSEPNEFHVLSPRQSMIILHSLHRAKFQLYPIPKLLKIITTQLSEYIARPSDTPGKHRVSPEDISDAFYGLKNMRDEYVEVRDVVKILHVYLKNHLTNQSFTQYNLCSLLFGFRSMKICRYPELEAVIPDLVARIRGCSDVFDAKSVVMMLTGISEMWSHDIVSQIEHNICLTQAISLFDDVQSENHCNRLTDIHTHTTSITSATGDRDSDGSGANQAEKPNEYSNNVVMHTDSKASVTNSYNENLKLLLKELVSRLSACDVTDFTVDNSLRLYRSVTHLNKKSPEVLKLVGKFNRLLRASLESKKETLKKVPEHTMKPFLVSAFWSIHNAPGYNPIIQESFSLLGDILIRLQTRFTAEEISSIINSLQDMKGDLIETQKILGKLLEPCVQLANKGEFKIYNIANLLYGLQLSRFEDGYVSGYIDAMTVALSKATSPIKPHNVTSMIHGLRSLQNPRQVGIFVDMLASKVETTMLPSERFSAAQLSYLLFGLQEMHTEYTQIRRLLKILANHWSTNQPDIKFNNKQFINSMTGFKRMSSDHEETLQLLKLMTHQLEGIDLIDFRRSDSANVLIGLQNMTSDSEIVQKYLQLIYDRLLKEVNDGVEIQGRTVSGLMFGLSRMNETKPEVRALIRLFTQIITDIRNRDKKWSAEDDIKEAPTENNNTEFMTTGNGIITSDTAFDAYTALRGLRSCNIADPDVRALLLSITLV